MTVRRTRVFYIVVGVASLLVIGRQVGADYATAILCGGFIGAYVVTALPRDTAPQTLRVHVSRSHKPNGWGDLVAIKNGSVWVKFPEEDEPMQGNPGCIDDHSTLHDANGRSYFVVDGEGCEA